MTITEVVLQAKIKLGISFKYTTDLIIERLFTALRKVILVKKVKDEYKLYPAVVTSIVW